MERMLRSSDRCLVPRKNFVATLTTDRGLLMRRLISVQIYMI